MTFTAAERGELRRIISLAQDQPLESAQHARLVELLQSPEARAEYAAFIATNASLELHSARNHLARLTEVELPVAPANPTSPPGVAGRPAPVAAIHKAIRRPVAVSHSRLWALRSGWVAAVAASLALALIVSHNRNSRATIVAAEGATFADGAPVELGSAVGAEWLELQTGTLRIAYRQGAQIALQAPAKFRVTERNAGELEHGVLNAHVPESAIGYTLVTPRMTVQDLSTGFALSAPRAGGAEMLLVTAGRVAATARSSAEFSSPSPAPVEVSAGEVLTARTDRQQVLLHKRAARELRPRTSTNIKFLGQHPASLGYNTFEHDDLAFVFLESVARPLTEELPLNLLSAGRWAKFGEAGTLPAGSVVDCYLVHYAPASSDRRQFRGTLRFPGKIVGVLATSDRLNATNQMLGADWTLQCQHNQRGVEQTPDLNADVVTLSPDGHTLSVSFRTEEALDQLRVLVEPRDPPAPPIEEPGGK